MAPQRKLSPADIIATARHYEATGDRWICAAKDLATIYIPNEIAETTRIPLFCRSIVHSDSGLFDRELRVHFREQLLLCSVRDPPIAPGPPANYVRMAFSKMFRPEISHLPYDAATRGRLVAQNNEFITALELIAAEIGRVCDDMCETRAVIADVNNQEVHMAGTEQINSFCQSVHCGDMSAGETRGLHPLDKRIYRVRLPVIASGRIAVQYGDGAAVTPVVFVADDASQTKEELKVPIFTRARDVHPSRYDNLTRENVGKMMTRNSRVWGVANFKELLVCAGKITTIVECVRLIIRPQEKIGDDEINISDVLNSGLTTSTLEQVARSTWEPTRNCGSDIFPIASTGGCESDELPIAMYPPPVGCERDILPIVTQHAPAMRREDDMLPIATQPAPVAPTDRDEAVLAGLTDAQRALVEERMAADDNSAK